MIDAMAKSGAKGAGDKAEAILNKMQAKYDTRDIHVKPDIQSFGAVLNYWAKEGNGARAEAILNHMEKLMHQEGFEDLGLILLYTIRRSMHGPIAAMILVSQRLKPFWRE